MIPLWRRLRRALRGSVEPDPWETIGSDDGGLLYYAELAGRVLTAKARRDALKQGAAAVVVGGAAWAG